MSAKAEPRGCPSGYKQTEEGAEYWLARHVQHLHFVQMASDRESLKTNLTTILHQHGLETVRSL